ncbi:MAG: undecaprenyl-diphosphate phosphatase [bacterium]|nr:undecaprenyl-diphosphate phosphatase [bacterium]
MSLWFAVALGLLQGLTEFLPVSSSGHLALAQMLIPGFEQPGVVFDAALHLGTACAVIWYERRQLMRWLWGREDRAPVVLIIVGMFATAAIAFPLRSVAGEGFSRPLWVGGCLLITAAIVLASRFMSGGQFNERTGRWSQAIVVGLAQGAAVFPGISRSGSTIVAGMGVGFDRVWAARFSFLLSVPAILGAAFIETLGEIEQVRELGPEFWEACVVGAAVAAVSGLVALKIVIKTLSSHHFHHFGWYCAGLGLVVIGLVLGGVW